MRRLIALFLVALSAAVYVGRVVPATGAATNAQVVSSRDLASEELEISNNQILGCFVAGTYGPVLRAGGTPSVNSTGAAAWAAVRAEGLAITQYVANTYHYHPTASDLAAAGQQLGNMFVENAARAGLACASSDPRSAIGLFSPQLRQVLETVQAATTVFHSHQSVTWPATDAGIRSYYQAHQQNYETVCLSVALVSDAQVGAFSADRAAGLSPAALIKKYSLAASAATGGAYGCFPPASAVAADTATVPTGSFTRPYPYAQGGMVYQVYFLVTSRNSSPLATVTNVVARDIFDYNNRVTAVQRADIARSEGVRGNGHSQTVTVTARSLSFAAPRSLDVSLVPGASALSGTTLN